MLASAQTLKIGLVDTSEILAKLPDTAAAQKQVDDVTKNMTRSTLNLARK